MLRATVVYQGAAGRGTRGKVDISAAHSVQRVCEAAELAGRLITLASGREGNGDALPIHQDAALLAATLRPGETVHHALAPGRKAYLVPARGSVTVNGTSLPARAGAAVSGEEAIEIVAEADSESRSESAYRAEASPELRKPPGPHSWMPWRGGGSRVGGST